MAEEHRDLVGLWSLCLDRSRTLHCVTW